MSISFTKLKISSLSFSQAELQICNAKESMIAKTCALILTKLKVLSTEKKNYVVLTMNGISFALVRLKFVGECKLLQMCGCMFLRMDVTLYEFKLCS